MKKNNYISQLSLAILFFFAVSTCEKEVKLELPQEEEKLTVLCNFSPDEPFSIQLSKSSPLFSKSTSTSIIRDAKVEICRGDQSVDNIFANPSSSDSKVKFTSTDDAPSIREYYTLKIDLEGVQPITATSWIPEPVEIAHTAVGEITPITIDANSDFQDYKVKLSLQFKDPAGEKNYYQISFYQELSNLASLQDTVIQIESSSGFDLIDNSLIESFNVLDGGLLLKDLTFDGEINDLLFEPTFRYQRSSFKPKGIIIELRTISEDYYKYYSSVYRQVRHNYEDFDGTTLNGTLPFSDPVQIYSNIRNGYGIFAGFSKKRVKIPIEL